MSNIRKPSIHLGGTTAGDLFRANLGVVEALRDVLIVMRGVAPHGRDYYPQGDEAIVEAGREHRDRVERIKSVLAEIEEICEYISDVQDDKAGKRQFARVRRDEP